MRTHHQIPATLRCKSDNAKQRCTAVFDQLGDWGSNEGIEIEIKSNRGRDVFAYQQPLYQPRS